MPKLTPDLKEPTDYFVWCVAHIESDMMDRVDDDLNKFKEYSEIEAYIPTIKVLKKKFKGKNIYDNVPLLFNYGFFRIPKYQADNIEFLEKMKSRISCIYSWLRDRANKGKMHIIARITDEEVNNMGIASRKLSIYSANHLKYIKKGSIVTLQGYPWTNIEAKILRVDENKKQVRVELMLNYTTKEVIVSFENIFYTIYNDKYQIDKLKEQSLDSIKNHKNNYLDSVLYKSEKIAL